jgi:multisubunit Na+/H+ antiporter MnhE subunit
MSNSVRLVAYWALWWLISLGLWLLLTSTVSFNEIATGFGAAAVAASAASAVHAREKMATPLRPGREWLRFGFVLPRRVVADTWLLTRVLAGRLAGRDPEGGFREVTLPEAGEAGERRMLETLATLVISVSPNVFVVAFDDERRVALLHELVARDHATLEEVMTGS